MDLITILPLGGALLVVTGAALFFVARKLYDTNYITSGAEGTCINISLLIMAAGGCILILTIWEVLSPSPARLESMVGK